MRKRAYVGLVAVLLVAAISLVAAGCGGISSTTVQQKATTMVASAKTSLAEAKTKGVTIPADEEKTLTAAEGELKSNPLQALVDASMAKANIDNDIKDAFNVANQTYTTAKGAAQSAIKTAVAGSDLAAANASLASAEAAKAKATTIALYYNPTTGPIYFANLAAQQAAAASVAKATATGQQQGVTTEQKALQGYVSQIISGMNKYLSGKRIDPSTYNVGITKVSADGTTVTGVAAPQQMIPGASVYTFIFNFKNGAWAITSVSP